MAVYARAEGNGNRNGLVPGSNVNRSGQLFLLIVGIAGKHQLVCFLHFCRLQKSVSRNLIVPFDIRIDIDDDFSANALERNCRAFAVFRFKKSVPRTDIKFRHNILVILSRDRIVNGYGLFRARSQCKQHSCTY